jgi:hypothetical protein
MSVRNRDETGKIMSNMTPPDNMDALVSSVRNLVAARDTGPEKLVLTQALRVDPPPAQITAEEEPILLPEPAPEDVAAPTSDTAAMPAMDEAALRALIAEVLREELTGVMGEKITQNVRKMVRREINRLLATQQLD